MFSKRIIWSFGRLKMRLAGYWETMLLDSRLETPKYLVRDLSLLEFSNSQWSTIIVRNALQTPVFLRRNVYFSINLIFATIKDRTMNPVSLEDTVCPDALGESSDIAAADVWPGGTPVGEENRAFLENDPG